MNDLPRQKLRELIATYGRSLVDDPRRCEALLRDLCWEHRREVNVLVNALRLLALAAVLMLVLIGMAVWLVDQMWEDRNLWKTVTAAAQTAGDNYEQAGREYQNYLATFPNGFHASEAKQMLEVTIRHVEDRNWQRTQDAIKKAGSDIEQQVQVLEDFISQNSSSRWLPDARNNRSSLQSNYLQTLRKAAEAGSSTGMANLGVMYQNGLGIQRDYREAIRWYRRAADTGDARGMAYLGRMYANGFGVERDYTEALKWYHRAVDAGDVRGMAYLGSMYRDGRGVQADYTEALKWYRKAADAGDPPGMSSLGVMYVYGWGLPRDYTEALKWCAKAAQAGDANSMSTLGGMYANGLGVAKDYKEAMNWFRKATGRGSLSGMVNLGLMYQNGSAVAQDYNEALKCYRTAAEADDTDGMWTLGAMY